MNSALMRQFYYCTARDQELWSEIFWLNKSFRICMYPIGATFISISVSLRVTEWKKERL